MTPLGSKRGWVVIWVVSIKIFMTVGHTSKRRNLETPKSANTVSFLVLFVPTDCQMFDLTDPSNLFSVAVFKQLFVDPFVSGWPYCGDLFTKALTNKRVNWQRKSSLRQDTYCKTMLLFWNV